MHHHSEPVLVRRPEGVKCWVGGSGVHAHVIKKHVQCVVCGDWTVRVAIWGARDRLGLLGEDEGY